VIVKRIAAVCLLVLTACSSSSSNNSSGSPTFSTFQNASLVLGQSNFTNSSLSGNPAAGTLSYPYGVAGNSSSLFISDISDNRVVGYTSVPTTNGAAANFAVGQANLTTNGAGTGANQMDRGTGIHVSGTKLLISDEATNKVLIWNTLPTASNTSADIALGHTGTAGTGGGACAADKLNGPGGVFVTPGGKVIVANSSHNRVHIWNSLAAVATGDAADIILGDSGCVNGLTQSLMDYPTSAWSDDTRLVIVDSFNHRVLIWNTFPSATVDPDVVIGQANFTSNSTGATQTAMNSPLSVTSDGTRLFVSDVGNNRVLIYNSFPTTNGAAASAVLGQSNFTNNTDNDDDQDGNQGSASARTLNFPGFVNYVNGKLYVSDRGNYRVLAFQAQ